MSTRCSKARRSWLKDRAAGSHLHLDGRHQQVSPASRSASRRSSAARWHLVLAPVGTTRYPHRGDYRRDTGRCARTSRVVTDARHKGAADTTPLRNAPPVMLRTPSRSNFMTRFPRAESTSHAGRNDQDAVKGQQRPHNEAAHHRGTTPRAHSAAARQNAEDEPMAASIRPVSCA